MTILMILLFNLFISVLIYLALNLKINKLAEQEIQRKFKKDFYSLIDEFNQTAETNISLLEERIRSLQSIIRKIEVYDEDPTLSARVRQKVQDQAFDTPPIQRGVTSSFLKTTPESKTANSEESLEIFTDVFAKADLPDQNRSSVNDWRSISHGFSEERPLPQLPRLDLQESIPWQAVENDGHRGDQGSASISDTAQIFEKMDVEIPLFQFQDDDLMSNEISGRRSAAADTVLSAENATLPENFWAWTKEERFEHIAKLVRNGLSIKHVSDLTKMSYGEIELITSLNRTFAS